MAVKLYYFDIRGLAEPIRQILIYGDIEFEDVRIPFPGFPPTVPPEIKEKSRWGQLPLVEFEGKTLAQSLAITRYFAKKANLVPEDAFDAALCDEYVDAVRDMMMAAFGPVMIEDGAEKAKKIEEVKKTINPKYLTVFEGILNKNGKYLVGNSLTWADLYLALFFDHFQRNSGADYSEGYENLKRHKATVENTPKIKEWLAKRPQTKY